MEGPGHSINIPRDWIYTKILDACQKKYHGKLCGIVLAGGSGAGKTTFCKQLKVERPGNRKHSLIKNKLIASYVIPTARDRSGEHIVQFLHSIYSQLIESSSLSRFREQPDSAWLREAVDNPDEVFKNVLLFPLLECEIQHKVVIFLVDGLNLDLVPPAPSNDTQSKTIPQLLSKHAHLFPRWLLPVFTTRQSTMITTHFPGFRRISIDDLRKTHVIQDIQQFILARLQADRSISKKITKDSTELLSLLHVKSAACFLYIKKVMDGISENYILLEEIREIPGTLNGLYLWLCQKQFNKKNFPQILQSNKQIESNEEYQKLLTQLRPMLSAEYRAKSLRPGEGEDEPIGLYHYSLAEWFTQAKFCGPLYECKLEDGVASIKQWRLQAQQSIYDKPDLVSQIKNHQNEEQVQIEEKKEEMWMLLGTEERNKRKQKLNSQNLEPAENPEIVNDKVVTPEIKDKSLTECVMEDDALNIKRLLIPLKGEPNEEVVQAALLSAREGSAEVLRSLIELAGVDPNSVDENGWTLLRTASWAGKKKCVKVLVDLHASVNQVDGDLRSALRAACWAGHLECVELLLNAGAEVNHIDSEGRTAMIAACYMGHMECDGRTALSVAVTCDSESATKLVTLLIDNGANPNIADKDGMSPLLIAAFEGKTQVCEILLENGADMDHADKEGKTALFAAASMGHLEILNLLMFWGCYVDGIDCEGRTVLSVAAAEGSAPIVKVLLDRGLDEQHRDNAGWGPLHYAAFEGHTEIVDQLTMAGAELDMLDSDGKTALHLACGEGHYDVVVQLLRARAKVNIVNLQGRSPLRIALLEGFLDIAGLLLDNGADIDYMDNDSRSTLYIMALESDVKSVEFLLNHGANTELKDSDGRTALHVAAWQGYSDIVQVLLLNGADVNSLDGGRRSALLSACWQGHRQVVDILLTAGADVNQQCDQGASPLAVSAQEDHISVLQLLLQHGADPLSQDHHGRDAYRVALRNNNTVAANILENFMKRLSDSKAAEKFARLGLDDDPGSPLYASPTVYGYAKIGQYSRHSTPAVVGDYGRSEDVEFSRQSTPSVHADTFPSTQFQEISRQSSPSAHADTYPPTSLFQEISRQSSPSAIAETDIFPPTQFQDSEFLFSQTGHMAIILGRNNTETNNKPSGIFENIKEKARSGFSATKRNFL